MEEEYPIISTPYSVTVRRNPPRRARATSALKPPQIPPLSPTPLFPTTNPKNKETLKPETFKPESNETLKVYLRIKPNIISKKPLKSRTEVTNVWPIRNKNEKKINKPVREACVTINDDSCSVTLCPPKGLREAKRAKTEVFEGFSRVFSADSTQVEVYESMVKPLVEDFLSGKSGTLVALGPSGSGKTHTVFGSPRKPGMVPLALKQIFPEEGSNINQLSRTFYLSMFEISERGKAERFCDLLQDGGDLCFQQSAIRGLQEVSISNIQQAECLIARGMLKRATAMTNSNSQSSRSQCVISIRTVENKIEEESDFQLKGAVLTIVDLAGAEREKKTGNQGARLLESNFINNTSMVFGLCLRSLLEHQKNPKRPLQKHFQSSLLTKYLREYLEGKKRMALILTVKSGEEDYVDSSLLLRQASPYTKIKFDNTEDSVNLLCIKRHKQRTPRIESSKRMKFSPEEHLNDVRKEVGEQLCEDSSTAPQLVPVDHAVTTICPELSEHVSLDEHSIGSAKQERSYMIMQNFAKALWNVLKEYKTNLKVAGNKIEGLTKSLEGEKARNSEMEKELKDLKNSLSYGKQISSAKEDSFSIDRSSEQVGCQGQSYQVGEIPIQNFREVLVDEQARSPELEIELEALKEISVDRSAEEVEHEEQSCQVGEIPVQNFREVLVDEQARSPELEIELEAIKEISVDRSVEEVEHEEQSCQSTDQEYGGILGDVDGTESLTKLTDVGKNVTQFKDSNNQKPPVTFPDLLTKTKQCSLEPLPELIDLTDEGKYDSQFKVSEHQKPLARFLEFAPESSREQLTLIRENSCHSVESNGTCRKKYKGKQVKDQDFDVNNKSKIKKKPSPLKPCNAEKPKRRLAPASSILLKDFGGLTFEDENEKPKGSKGGKKLAPSERNITQGSLSLVRLLNSNVHF